MKIQKQLSKKVDDKIYYKYVVVIPKLKIEEAGFQNGDKLIVESTPNALILRKKEN
jgi:hypothetical protein